MIGLEKHLENLVCLAVGLSGLPYVNLCDHDYHGKILPKFAQIFLKIFVHRGESTVTRCTGRTINQVSRQKPT